MPIPKLVAVAVILISIASACASSPNRRKSDGSWPFTVQGIDQADVEAIVRAVEAEAGADQRIARMAFEAETGMRAGISVYLDDGSHSGEIYFVDKVAGQWRATFSGEWDGGPADD